MWYIFVLFYLLCAASSSLVNITDLYGTWIPLTPLNWTFAQNCGNSTLTISTTFQLGDNSSYVEKFLVGSGNCTEDEDFLKSVVLSIATLGNMSIDYDYDKENVTEPVPSPEPVIVKIPSPIPSSVHKPEPSGIVPAPRIPVPETVPVPESETIPVPGSETVPVPESETVPGSMPSGSIPSGSNPVSQIPVPSKTVPSPEPSPVIIAGRTKRSVGANPSGVPESTVNDTYLEPEMNSTMPAPSPSLNNSTENSTATNFTSQWVHVYFTPSTFNVTIISNETDIFFSKIQNGPCMPIVDYWKNETLGCPCDSLWWNTTGYYNSSTKTFEGGSQITPSQCPNNTCQEALFLNDTITYANLRLNITTFENGTVANKTVEITKMSPNKDIGYSYGAEDILYVFWLSNGNDTDIPVIEEPIPAMNETLDTAGSMTLPMTSIVTILIAFLLSMY